MQEWPNSITLVRHGESRYNASAFEQLEGFSEFMAQYKEESALLTPQVLARGGFPSPTLREMASSLMLKAPPLKSNDFDTQLTQKGWDQAVKTSERLSGRIALPKAVYVSPYVRTRQTHDGFTQGWPELKTVRVYEDDRIREQEHGVRGVYPHPAIYAVFRPEYALLHKLSTSYEYKHEGGESLLNVRERLRSFIVTLIREHGGTPETLRDVFIDKLLSSIIGSTARKAMDTLNITPDTLPEDVMIITHHLTILAMRANIERWNRQRFLWENAHNRPVNCGVTIYRGTENDQSSTRQGKHGRLVLNPAEYNMKLY